MFRLGELCIDAERHVVTVRGARVHLSYLEFRALCAIAGQDGRVVPYEALAHLVWGCADERSRRRLAVVVSRLRSKLGGDYIETVMRVGYRLSATAAR